MFNYIFEESLEENRIIFREFEALEDEASMLSRIVVNQPTLRNNSKGKGLICTTVKSRNLDLNHFLYIWDSLCPCLMWLAV